MGKKMKQEVKNDNKAVDLDSAFQDTQMQLHTGGGKLQM